MSAPPTFETRKRAVNLTLNEQVVAQARALTGNLSAKVEELLIEYVQRATCNVRTMHARSTSARPTRPVVNGIPCWMRTVPLPISIRRFDCAQ